MDVELATEQRAYRAVMFEREWYYRRAAKTWLAMARSATKPE